MKVPGGLSVQILVCRLTDFIHRERQSRGGWKILVVVKPSWRSLRYDCRYSPAPSPTQARPPTQQVGSHRPAGAVEQPLAPGTHPRTSHSRARFAFPCFASLVRLLLLHPNYVGYRHGSSLLSCAPARLRRRRWATNRRGRNWNSHTSRTTRRSSLPEGLSCRCPPPSSGASTCCACSLGRFCALSALEPWEAAASGRRL